MGKAKAQYDVCVGDSIQDLRIQVQLYMAGGWRPQGGMLLQDGTYHQAMTRDLEEYVKEDWSNMDML